ncbi:MAG TPA: DUF2269 family protein [Gemmatimonadaceae bacterium]|nr:DUF2269 family protein [Gemmatimonadaceae bacterium]
MGLYGALKVVHVLSVVLWLGGGAAITIITAQIMRAKDLTALGKLLPFTARFGPTIGGPSSGLVLLTGIAMVSVSGLGFKSLWISLGFAGMIVHFVAGPLLLRPLAIAFGKAVAASNETQIAVAGSRLRNASTMYLVLMMAVAAVMVIKPM